MSNFINGSPYLRTTREFPENVRDLAFQANKSYLETASAINLRTIGLFPVLKPAISGEQWFIKENFRQQGLRQVFTFGSIAAGTNLSIPYKLSGFDQFVRIWGTCKTALPDNRPIPYASIAPNANIDLRVDSSNIIIAVGAASPNIVSGTIVLEWISMP